MVNFLLEVLGWSVDAASAGLITILRWTVRTLLVIGGTTLLFLIATGWGWTAFATALLWLWVFEIAMLGLLLIPLFNLLKMNQRVRQYSQAVWQDWASLLLWLLTVGITLTLFLRWGRTEYIPLLVVVVTVTALGYWVCDMRFSAKAAVYRSWLIAGMVLLLVALPSVGPMAHRTLKRIDIGIGGSFSPEPVPYHPDLMFFDPNTGQARYWYCECDPENLFANVIDRAFHPKTGLALQPLTYEKEQQLRRHWEQKKQEKAKAEQRVKVLAKARETARQRELAEELAKAQAEQERLVAEQKQQAEQERLTAEQERQVEAEKARQQAEWQQEEKRLAERRRQLAEEQRRLQAEQEEKYRQVLADIRRQEQAINQSVTTTTVPNRYAVWERNMVERKQTARGRFGTTSQTTNPTRVPHFIPRETMVIVVLQESISTREFDRTENFFAATLAEPLLDERGELAIPADAVVDGYIPKAIRSGRFKGTAQLALALQAITYHRDEKLRLETNTLTFEASPEYKNDIGRVAVSTGVGVLTGIIRGGAKTAVIDGGLGAGAGLVANFLIRGKEVDLPAGTVLAFQLTKPLPVPRF